MLTGETAFAKVVKCSLKTVAPLASDIPVANGAINSFVLAAALEMPKGIRVNVVSPSKVADISSSDLINAYLKCIDTAANGEIIRIGYN